MHIMSLFSLWVVKAVLIVGSVYPFLNEDQIGVCLCHNLLGVLVVQENSISGSHDLVGWASTCVVFHCLFHRFFEKLYLNLPLNVFTYMNSLLSTVLLVMFNKAALSSYGFPCANFITLLQVRTLILNWLYFEYKSLCNEILLQSEAYFILSRWFVPVSCYLY